MGRSGHRTYQFGDNKLRRRKQRNNEDEFDDSHARDIYGAFDMGEVMRTIEDNLSRFSTFQPSSDFQPPYSIHAKLEISHPEDAHEKQADEVADAVMDGDTGKSQGALAKHAGEVSRKGEGDAMSTPPGFDQQLQSSKGQGQKLDDNTRSELEEHTGTDLGDVNIHTSPQAHDMSESINAKAFTHGQDIYFKQGNYNPDSKEGKELLAHEVAHTVQQREGLSRKIQKQNNAQTTTTTTTPNDDNTSRNMQVGFYLSISVTDGDPDGVAYQEYLMQVYGKTSDEAQSISNNRGPSGRWNNFNARVIGDKPEYVVVSVSPKRYLQNLFGDEILSQDTSLMEAYLLGGLTSELYPTIPPTDIQHPDFLAINQVLTKLKDVDGLVTLYNYYKDLMQVYYSTFENIDFEIDGIKEEHDFEIQQTKSNQYIAVATDPPLIQADPLALDPKIERSETISSHEKQFPELGYLSTARSELFTSDYKYAYDGILPTNPPDYTYVAEKAVELHSYDYSEDIIALLKKALVKKVEDEYLKTGAYGKSGEEYVSDLQKIIDIQKQTIEYQKLLKQKEGLWEFLRISDQYLNGLLKYRGLIQSDDEAIWGSDVEREDYEYPIVWRDFLQPAQGAEPFLTFYKNYPDIKLDVAGYVLLRKRSHTGLSDTDVTEIVNSDENTRDIVKYMGVLESGQSRAKDLLGLQSWSLNQTPSIPLKAIIIANNVPFPLKLYLKFDNSKWSIVDLTSVIEPAIYEGGVVVDSKDLAQNQASISAAWLKYLNNNHLRSGKIIIEKPQEYFAQDTDPMWRADNISENMSSESETVHIGTFFPKYSTKNRITAKITAESAEAMADRMLAGGQGFDPTYVPKNGGSMFFVSKGNPYTGSNPQQTIEIEVSVKIPDDVLIFTDADLLDIQSELMIDVFEQNGAKIRTDANLIAKFKEAFRNYNTRPYNAKNFTMSASELGISKSLRDRILRNERANAENTMWNKVGEKVKVYKSGFGKVVMGENGPSPYSENPGEFLVVSDATKVKITGGDKAFVDVLAKKGAESTSQEALEVMRNARVGRVKAVFRVGGRLLMLIAVAQDIYSLVYAKDKLREITRIAGGWTGAWIAGGTFAAFFTPADTAGPWAWVAHGLGTLVASAVGYTVGSEISTWVYDLQIEEDDDGVQRY